MNENEISAGMAATPGYRYAVSVGNELHMAGQVPLDAGGELVGPGSPVAQAAQCLENLALVVRANGFGVGDIRHLTIYVAGDQPDLNAAWTVITSWFAGPVPPATLLGVRSLGHVGQLVEIDSRVIRG